MWKKYQHDGRGFPERLRSLPDRSMLRVTFNRAAGGAIPDCLHLDRNYPGWTWTRRRVFGKGNGVLGSVAPVSANPVWAPIIEYEIYEPKSDALDRLRKIADLEIGVDGPENPSPIRLPESEDA